MTGFFARHGHAIVGLLLGFMSGVYLYNAGYWHGQRSSSGVEIQPLDEEEFGRVRQRLLIDRHGKRIDRLEERVQHLERRAGMGEAGQPAPHKEPLGALQEA